MPLVLAGCGNTGSAGGDGDSATLTVWGAVQSPTAESAIEEAERLFAQDHPDVEIEHVIIPAEQLTSKLLASAGTQSGPDLFTYNTVVDFHALESAGVMADMTEEWESYEDHEQFPEAYVWRNSDDRVKTVFPYSDHIALFYNQDILDDLGLTPPETIDDLEAALKTVADSGEYEGLAMSGAPDPGGAWQFMPLLLEHGVDYCNFDDSETITREFARVDNWVASGYLPESTAVWEQGDAWQQFSTGKYAFGINGNWNLGAAEELGFEWGTTQYPAGPEGSIVYLGGDGLAIGAFGENPELAWDYITSSRLSHEGSLINFRANGSLPTREDTADAPEIGDNEKLAPFVEAMETIRSWPNSPKSAEMQLAVGKAVSGMISGQLSAAEAAQQAEAGVAQAREAGGGDC